MVVIVSIPPEMLLDELMKPRRGALGPTLNLDWRYRVIDWKRPDERARGPKRVASSAGQRLMM
jgi:hypothetical protein